MKSFGLYFLFIGVFGIGTALAGVKNEREFFLVLATVPTAFLVIRVMEFLRKKS